MAKTSGVGDNFYIAGFDLSGDVSSIDQMSGGPTLGDVTGIKSSANERIGLLRDGDWQFTSFFNNALLAEHAALSTLPTADVVALYLNGTTLGNQAAGISAKQVNYDPTRDDTGNLTLKVELQASGFGYDWCEQLTAGLATDTTATNHTSVDETASTTFGAQGYAVVTAITGTSVDVKIQHSADNSTFATLMDFGSFAAAGAVRGAATGTVNRYIRVATTGTFTSATFAVIFNRNATAVSF